MVLNQMSIHARFYFYSTLGGDFLLFCAIILFRICGISLNQLILYALSKEAGRKEVSASSNDGAGYL
jgi:hypothetical protein